MFHILFPGDVGGDGEAFPSLVLDFRDTCSISARVREATTTLAPFADNASAHALPIPLPPPVTMAVSPSRSNLVASMSVALLLTDSAVPAGPSSTVAASSLSRSSRGSTPTPSSRLGSVQRRLPARSRSNHLVPRRREHLGVCVEFPSVSWLAPDPGEALSGIRKVVRGVLADMRESRESPPEPLADHPAYSGRLVVREYRRKPTAVSSCSRRRRRA